VGRKTRQTSGFAVFRRCAGIHLRARSNKERGEAAAALLPLSGAAPHRGTNKT
jgi:hypothetical protein